MRILQLHQIFVLHTVVELIAVLHSHGYTLYEVEGQFAKQVDVS